jgi:hypothetical protein
LIEGKILHTCDIESEELPSASRLLGRELVLNAPWCPIAHPYSPLCRDAAQSHSERVTRAFDEVRKRTNVAMGKVTVDSDFSVIQINDPKGLPPAPIVPKVTGTSKPPRKPLSILLDPETPVFDEDITNFLLGPIRLRPGVTFRDRQVLKTRPPIVTET